jgi:hypothetical protein
MRQSKSVSKMNLPFIHTAESVADIDFCLICRGDLLILLLQQNHERLGKNDGTNSASTDGATNGRRPISPPKKSLD